MSQTSPHTNAPTSAIAELDRLAREAIDAKNYESALRHLLALETLAPNGRVRRDIALCHFYSERVRLARDWYRKSLELEPENSDGINNLARVSAMLGELEIRDEKVLEADTWNSLAQAQYNRGNFGLARKLFELATEADPDFIKAYYNLGILIRDEDVDAWIQRLEQRPPAGSESSPSFHFLVAGLYDRKGDYAKAMELYKQANDLKYRQDLKAYDEGRQDVLVGSIIQYFTAERIAALRQRTAALPLNPQRIAFVFGMPRTGSTLISRILAADPTVEDLGEAHFLIDCLNRVISRHDVPFVEAIDRLDDTGWQWLQQCYLARIGQRRALLVDKYLENFLFLGVIVALFPGARLIHAVRDRNDVMISCYKHMFPDGVSWSYNIGQMKHYYAAYLRLMEHWRAVLPPGIMEDFVYKDLVESPKTEIPRLEKHCGLGPGLAERQFHQRQGMVKTASAQQVRKPIYKDAVGSFERYRPYLSFD